MMNASLSSVLFILGGLLALTAGGELLIGGASRLAAASGISPLVIGLTVVAFGTSSPELAVALKASLIGQVDIAVGNVVGSNIFNVLFILGLSATLIPLTVASRLVRLDVPLMVGVSILVLLLGLDGTIGRWEAALLIGILIAYTWWSIVQGRKEPSGGQSPYEKPFLPAGVSMRRHVLLQSALIAGGLVLLGLGANWLVEGSVQMARRFGMSEYLIGLTIVAAGTSLPEAAASVLAGFRGERDIAVGNVVGSSLFNIVGVLGFSAAVARGGLLVSDAALRFDIPVMIAVAVACLPIFFTGHRIARWEGILLLAYYVAYIAHLVLAVVNAAVSRTFGLILLGFVLPLTVLGIAVSLWRVFRSAG